MTERVVLFLQFLASIFLLVGVGGLLHGWRALRLARQSEDWFPVDAVVVRSDLETEESTPDSTGQTITYWYPRIEFEYQFQGQSYRSNRVLFANVNFPRDEAEALVERHALGSRVKGYVNPDDPKLAVLERGVAGHGGRYAIPLIVGAIFLAVGIAVWFLAPLLGR